MNTATAPLIGIDDYLADCRRLLDDLPSATAALLIHDIEEIIVEVAAELDGRPEDLVGTPERFTAELRSSAGLSARPTPVLDDGAGAPIDQRSLLQIVRAAGFWMGATCLPWLREFSRELRPAWWAVRGIGVALALDRDHMMTGPGRWPTFAESRIAWTVLAALAVVASVNIGRRGRPAATWMRVGTAAASVIALAFIAHSIAKTDQLLRPMHDTVPTAAAVPFNLAGDPIRTVVVTPGDGVIDLELLDGDGLTISGSGYGIPQDLSFDLLQLNPPVPPNGFVVQVPGAGPEIFGSWHEVVTFVDQVIAER